MDGAYRILVSEDNPADRLLIREAFAECGYRCQLTIASSPFEVERLISAETFEFMLSDFGPDPMEDAALIRSIRQRAPLLPNVVLSGYADVRPAYQAGANAFVRKSADLDEFFAKVQGLMHFWIEVAEQASYNRLKKV
jgi:CheY-like chemotaxis protein